ncbi:MAG: reprolysin-like metallopeptidase [Acidobacteriota bacterium]
MWDNCANYGTGFPSFAIGETGTRTYTVVFVNGNSGEASCGNLTGLVITIYQSAKHNGKDVSCEPYSSTLAHELGHTLGLQDIFSGCGSYIMSQRNPNNPNARSVQSAECTGAGEKWKTSDELQQEEQCKNEPCGF